MFTAKNKYKLENNTRRGPIYGKIARSYQKYNSEAIGKDSINYEELIFLFKEQADYDRGIIWIINEDKDLLIREAAAANGNMFSNADYIQQMLNMYRAAEEIMESQPTEETSQAIIEEKARTREEINKRAEQLVFHYLKGNFSEDESQCAVLLRNQNNEIIELLKVALKGLNAHELNKSLRLAEAYAGLNDRHYNIETHIEITQKKFIQRDLKISVLTEEQEALFTKPEDQPWYKSLSRLEQNLFKLHASQITDGKHVIPTALRNIPGARNLYKKELVAVIGEREKILNIYFHSGTIASYNKDKEAAEAIASSSFRQIQAYIRANSEGKTEGKAKELTFVTLSSRRSLDSSDRLVVKQTEAATGQGFAEIAVGPFRRLDSSNIKEFIYENKLFEKLTAVFPEFRNKPELTPLRNYLEAHTQDLFGFKYREAMKLTKNMSGSGNININDKFYDEAAATVMPAIVALKHYLNNQAGPWGAIKRFFALPGSNNNARTVASLTALSNLLPENPILLSCKSGKDRTGYCSYLADVTSLFRRDPEIPESLISQKLIESGHIQFLAACNGGKPGCFGLKGVDIDGEIKGQEKLFSKAAHYSSSMPSLRQIFNTRRIVPAMLETMKDIWGHITGKSRSYNLQQAEAIAEKASDHKKQEYYKPYNKLYNLSEKGLQELLIKNKENKEEVSSGRTRLESQESTDSGIDSDISPDTEPETAKKLISAAKEYKAVEGEGSLRIILKNTENTEKTPEANSHVEKICHAAGKATLPNRKG